MGQPELHLASSSARRREILTALGVKFSYAGVDIDESRAPGETVAAMVVRLASEKALAAGSHSIPVLGADTIVALEDRVFGKPVAEDDAIAMLLALSGQSHRVLTGVACLSRGALATTVVTTEVRFRDIEPDEAMAYWQSGEAAGKAGGYAIQGLGGVFVESLSGSYSGVVGLPVFETAAMLRAAGVDLLELQT